MASKNFSTSRLNRIRRMLNHCVERGEIAGAVALISRRGETYIDAAGLSAIETATPMQADAIFRIASMTKPITAVAALVLIEEVQMRLDDPIDRWLPELAERAVLRNIDSELDDTVPALRAISVRDLLTFRSGIGALMTPPHYPIQKAIAKLEIGPGPVPPQFGIDEMLRRFGKLPLMYQPGDRWLYHSSYDLLTALIARVSKMPFETFLQERIFAPLGMRDTTFSVAPEKHTRLTTCYQRDGERLVTIDDGANGRSACIEHSGGSSGLFSTADDYLKFAQMLLNNGKYGSARLLARPSVEFMTSDHISAEQKARSPFFAPDYWDSHGFGCGVSVVTRRDDTTASVSSYGWNGGYGTAWCSDPREDMSAIFMIQRMMAGPDDMALNRDFFTLAYQAIDD